MLGCCSARDLLACSEVSHAWRALATHNALWRALCLHGWGHLRTLASRPHGHWAATFRTMTLGSRLFAKDFDQVCSIQQWHSCPI